MQWIQSTTDLDLFPKMLTVSWSDVQWSGALVQRQGSHSTGKNGSWSFLADSGGEKGRPSEEEAGPGVAWLC